MATALNSQILSSSIAIQLQNAMDMLSFSDIIPCRSVVLVYYSILKGKTTASARPGPKKKNFPYAGTDARFSQETL
jgi:hypothetical protein